MKRLLLHKIDLYSSAPLKVTPAEWAMALAKVKDISILIYSLGSKAEFWHKCNFQHDWVLDFHKKFVF